MLGPPKGDPKFRERAIGFTSFGAQTRTLQVGHVVRGLGEVKPNAGVRLRGFGVWGFGG